MANITLSDNSLEYFQSKLHATATLTGTSEFLSGPMAEAFVAQIAEKDRRIAELESALREALELIGRIY